MAGKSRNLLVKIVTFVLFGMLIVSFAIWGIGDIFRGGRKARPVAEVGSVSIGPQEYSRALSREVNRLSVRFGGRLDMEQARALGVVDQVLNQLIARALFDQKAKDLGLVVTDKQVRQEIQREPAFQNQQGQFDRNRFVQTLQTSNLSEQEYIDTLRRGILRQEMVGAVTDAVVAPQRLADALYRYREERRVAKAIVVRNDSITEVPEPDQAALEAFYKESSDRFMAPEYRTLTFVWLRPEDLAKEVAVSKEDLDDEFKARKEDLNQPERRVIEQMVFLDEAKAREAEKRLAAGEAFAKVAQELTGAPPVNIGAVERGDLPEALAGPAFSLALNTPSAPLNSPLGWHVLLVTAIEPAHEPTLDEVRQQLTHDIAMRKAVDSMTSIANQLDDELAAGTGLEDAARHLDLKTRRIEAIDHRGLDRDGKKVEGLPPGRFLDTAFETASGEDSLLVDTTGGGYFVLHVDKVEPAQLKPLEAVRDQAIALWRDAQRAELAKKKAEALAARLRQGEEFETLAAAEGLSVVTTDPLTRAETDPARALAPSLPGKLFQITTGEVVTAAAPAGQIVAKLVQVQPANPAGDKAGVAKVRDGLANAMRSDMIEEFVASLRGEYGVEVNQSALEDVLSSF